MNGQVAQPGGFDGLQALFAPHTAVEDVVTIPLVVVFLMVAHNLYKLFQEMKTIEWRLQT